MTPRVLFAVLLFIFSASGAWAATITVTTTSDDVTPNDGSVSLREAMTAIAAGSALSDSDIAAQNPTATNPFGTSDTILFAIPGAGGQTIALSSPLPPVKGRTRIDGYSQPGSSPNTSDTSDNAVIEIVIDGRSIIPNGLQIGGPFSLIRGLSVVGFTNAAIQIVSGSFNDIVGNFIGVRPDGFTEAAGLIGVSVAGTTADSNLIGYNTPANRNLIAGTETSVLIGGDSSSTLANQVAGNLIGTDRTGRTALPALGIGIHLVATNNTYIGPDTTSGGLASPNSSCSGACNVIVAGNRPGIEIEGPSHGGESAFIYSNFIGTNVNGTAALGGTDEIFVNGPTSYVEIGFNLISGGRNPGAGIRVTNTFSISIFDNMVGTNITGIAAIGNGGPGIIVSNAGALSIWGNVISGNTGAGVDLEGTSNAAIMRNKIGAGADGTTPIGNGGSGIALGLSMPAESTNVGALPAAQGNVIANNGGCGVVVKSGSRNAIVANSIYRNAGIGIDLGGDGVTPNDACDTDSGANNLQNTPSLTTGRQPDGSWSVTGTLNSTANTMFEIELFSTPLSGGVDEGQTYLGSTYVQTAADCNASFSFPLPSSAAGTSITATATDPAGNTSELSAPVFVPTPGSVPAFSEFGMIFLALALAGIALRKLVEATTGT